MTIRRAILASTAALEPNTWTCEQATQQALDRVDQKARAKFRTVDKNLQIDDVSVPGNTATATVTISGGDQRPRRITLHAADGGWPLDRDALD